MILWIDAQLSPAIAHWIKARHGIDARAVRDLGLRDAKDEEIFAAAREAGATIMSKDEDFAVLVERLGPPPHVLWITCGNTSNAALHVILETRLPTAVELIDRGEPLVEISDARAVGPPKGRTGSRPSKK